MMRWFKANRRWLAILLTVACVASVACIGGTVAKYVNKKKASGTASSPNFYFTSNLLFESGFTYKLGAATEKLTFTLSNAADSLRVSDDNVDYRVTVTEGAKLALVGEIPSTDPLQGTLTATGSPAEVTVELSGLQSGKTYVVTATGSAGFSTTLTATFTVLESKELAFKHVDATDPAFVLLTVWTEDLTGDAVIDFPEGVIPDNTYPGMGSVLIVDGAFTDAGYGTYTSRTYRFFKDTTYDASKPFSVKFAGVEATESIPS